eukprot:358853-Chlamydomonas_euryale.AAC.2
MHFFTLFPHAPDLAGFAGGVRRAEGGRAPVYVLHPVSCESVGHVWYPSASNQPPAHPGTQTDSRPLICSTSPAPSSASQPPSHPTSQPDSRLLICSAIQPTLQPPSLRATQRAGQTAARRSAHSQFTNGVKMTGVAVKSGLLTG